MDNLQFQNMDSWKGGGGKFGLTFKQIILMHISRCVINGSVEFIGGYKKAIPQANVTTYEYIPDSRDVYCNSIKMLRALLLGYFDEKMTKADKILKDEYELNHKTFLQQQEQGENIKTKWNTFRIDFYIRLFEELIMLSKRLNFFEEESAESEM